MGWSWHSLFVREVQHGLAVTTAASASGQLSVNRRGEFAARLPNPQTVHTCSWFGALISRVDQSRDQETPVIPLSESSVEPWSEERPDRLGWFRVFIEFAALLWVTVMGGLVIADRDGPTGARGLDWRIARWMDQRRTDVITRLAE